MLCEMLSLMRSYNSASCSGVWAVASDWEMGQIIMGGSIGGERLCNLCSVVRLHARNPFCKVVLHCVGMGLMDTIRMYMM